MVILRILISEISWSEYMLLACFFCFPIINIYCISIARYINRNWKLIYILNRLYSREEMYIQNSLYLTHYGFTHSISLIFIITSSCNLFKENMKYIFIIYMLWYGFYVQNFISLICIIYCFAYAFFLSWGVTLQHLQDVKSKKNCIPIYKMIWEM